MYHFMIPLYYTTDSKWTLQSPFLTSITSFLFIIILFYPFDNDKQLRTTTHVP